MQYVSPPQIQLDRVDDLRHSAYNGMAQGMVYKEKIAEVQVEIMNADITFKAKYTFFRRLRGCLKLLAGNPIDIEKRKDTLYEGMKKKFKNVGL